jgi:hypothetical protein
MARSVGMTDSVISYDELHDARKQLIETLQQGLTDSERQFLVSIKQGVPQWELMGIPDIEKLPALQWKLINIGKMDDAVRDQSLGKLKEVLQI